jgi:hypothetical protein
MAVFFVSLFLDWAGVDTPLGEIGSNGTEANSWWIAAALAVIAAGLFAAEALNYPPPFAWASLGLGSLAAVLVFFWALTEFVDATEGPSSPQLGAWIGLIAAAVGAVLAAVTWLQERP